MTAGFRPDEPTAWLMEGVLGYLRAQEADRVLAELTRLAAPASEVAMEDDQSIADLIGRSQGVEAMSEVAASFNGGLDEPVTVWLGRNGWEVTAEELAAVTAVHGRDATHAAGALVVARKS